MNTFLLPLKQHTVKGKQAEQIKQDQLLGLFGNSGNSSEPHHHLHSNLQNAENMNQATSAKCFFNKIIVNEQTMTDFSPIQNDN